MKLSLSEILRNASELETKQERVDYLRRNDSPALRALLKYAYDDKVKFLLPEGEPPYKPNTLPDQEGILYSELRRMYLFIEGGNPNLKAVRREYLFVQLLETVDQHDARLLIGVKDKKLPHKNITKKFVQEVYPGLLEN
jgi:hypothetical protein